MAKKSQKQKLIPGEWPPLTRPNLINRAYAWAEECGDEVPEKDRHRGLLVALYAIIVGGLAYGAVSILGYHNYLVVVTVAALLLLAGISWILRD